MSETSSPRSSCVVLVPVGHHIERDCELGLRELERRGYPVWRVYGYSAIDQARNQLATNALDQGFAELMWIDADVAFHPDDVDRLRAHGVPFSCGLYAKKGRRSFACNFFPESSPVQFGRSGGAGAGVACRLWFHPCAAGSAGTDSRCRTPAALQ